ncbi:MAG TPA: phytanoyl-CoA dioxygenase family protein [Polyangiaceae bacterium]
MLEASGFVCCRDAVDDRALARLLGACAPIAGLERSRSRSGATYGIRGLLWSSTRLRFELETSGVSALAQSFLGAAFPIDAIFFDKQLDANWSVPGHQDRLMPIETGTGVPKTIRNDVAYAEPSTETLGELVVLRVHFDAVGPDDGALEVVPGSHRRGVLETDAIRAVPLSDYRPCVVGRGDVLVLRPLLLHRSGRRASAGHRRVLHIVYAATQPSDGPRWKALPHSGLQQTPPSPSLGRRS